MDQGFTQNVYVRSDTTAPTNTDKIDGIRSFSFERSRDVEETTDTKDGTGYKTRQAQLMDSKVDMSGHFEATDTIQGILRSAYESGNTVYVTVHVAPNAAAGSKGWRIPVIVESYSANVDPSKPGEFSVSCSGNGAPVAV